MNKQKCPFDAPDKGPQLSPTNQDELLKGFDKKRRSFLKKLLITTAYVTPAILSFSIGDLEARAKKLPTRKNKKRRRG